MDDHFQALRDFLAREVVWHQSLWREPYGVEVLRVAPYTGVPIVREIRAERVVLVDEVQIANDARFGADLLDVGLWQEMAIAGIDRWRNGAEGRGEKATFGFVRRRRPSRHWYPVLGAQWMLH
jgi:hypothetical protein